MTGIVAAVVLTAGLVAEATRGQIIAGSAADVLASVSIDSRTIAKGALFVALKGERVDGHAYIADAVKHGAGGFLVSERTDADGAAVVLVKDTLIALQALGREIRRRSGAKVVAITGSAGKTTTKELLADILAGQFNVFRNRGNLNNHIGLPLSLTELARGPEIAVVELGMNHAGEIRTLVALAEPDIRVWTNVGDAHIGHFGSRDLVADAKAEVLESATTDSVAVVNADDPLIIRHAGTFPGRVITFGFDAAAMIRARDVRDRGFDGTSAQIETPAGSWMLHLKLPGRVHLMNALAATAVAIECGVRPESIAGRLAEARPVLRRGSEVISTSGARVIDDSYNASPAAMQAMLAALATTPTIGRRVAILGEMLELGSAAWILHEACGRAAAQSGVDVLVAIGGQAADGFVAGAKAAGFSDAQLHRFADSASAAAPVVSIVKAGDVVLVKGSRGTRTDIVADALQAGGTR